MKRKIIHILAITAVFAFSSILAQDSTQIAAWNNFNNRYAGKWIVRWDQSTKTPSSIYGSKSEASHQITAGAEAVVRDFFQQNDKIFKLRSADQLFLDKQLQHRGMHHLYFTQKYSGIPVFTGEYNVTLAEDGSLRMIGGKFFPNIEIDVTPSVTASQAEQSAQKYHDVQSLRQNPISELVIFSKSGQYLLAFKVILLGKEPLKDWLTMVDAKTREVVFSEDVTVHTDGSGYVYPKDPVNSSLTTVTLPRLAGAGNYLEGSYVKALNEDQARAYSPNAQFFYTPPSYTQMDYTHFDEVNLYYHVDRFAAHLANDVSFPGLGRVIEATAHVGTDYNNAYYDLYGTRNIFFGDGDRVRFYDFSKKEDVIYHEFQHAVSHYIGLQYSGESAALHEGYSDYFPASYTQDSHIGEWVTIATNTGDLRIVANDVNYFRYGSYNNVQYAWNTVDGGYLNPAGSQHANSMIWSGAVWDLRAQLGSTIGDFLALKGIYYRNGYATFLQAREGIIQADIDYYGGSHQYTIMHTFYLRGIGADGVLPLSVSISGPSVVYHADPKGQPANCESWTANVTGGVSPYSYAWTGGYGTPSGSSYQECFSWNGYGGGSYQFTLRVDVTDAQSSTAFATKSVTAYNSGGEIDPIAAPGSDLQLVRVPQEYSLGQNYPNPFNPETQISYALPEPSDVTITVSDLLGREIAALVHGQVGKGYRVARWNGTDNSGNKVGSGIYFYRINAVGESGKRFTKVMKMLFAK